MCMVVRIRRLREDDLIDSELFGILVLIGKSESFGSAKSQQHYLYGDSETFGNSKKKWRKNYMNNKFTVINSTDEDKLKEMNRINRIAKLNEIWGRQYYTALEKSCTERKGKIKDLPQDELAKIGFAGIKYICSMRDVTRANRRLGIDQGRTLTEEQVRFTVIDGIFTILGCLTLRNFVTTFPIEKYYDGTKWEEKDYFYTMEVLSKMDWDKPIGRDELSELLWDYMNADLRHAYVEFTTAMSAIYRARTGKGIAETWLDDMGIPTYSVDRETGIMKNNQTGDIMKPKKVSHIQIVK